MGDEAAAPETKTKRPAEDRERRLAEALRANLHRRKAQSRARSDSLEGGTSDEKEG
jgi:hypothetical protein